MPNGPGRLALRLRFPDRTVHELMKLAELASNTCFLITLFAAIPDPALRGGSCVYESLRCRDRSFGDMARRSHTDTRVTVRRSR